MSRLEVCENTSNSSYARERRATVATKTTSLPHSVSPPTKTPWGQTRLPVAVHSEAGYDTSGAQGIEDHSEYPDSGAKSRPKFNKRAPNNPEVRTRNATVARKCSSPSISPPKKTRGEQTRPPVAVHSETGDDKSEDQGIDDHSQCSDSGYSSPPKLPSLSEPGIQTTDYADIIHKLSRKYREPETAVIPVIDCKDNTIMFIVYSDACNRETHQNDFGHDTIFKSPKVVSNEAIDVMEECQSQNCYLTAQQRNCLKHFIQQNAEELFSAHSNLNIISTSAIKSKGGEMIKDRPCIVLYCTSKGYIPVGEKEFPKTVSMADQMVDIDVREGHFQFGYLPKASNLRHDKLRMGCEFSIENGQYTGTIGPFVDLQGELAFLTCAHLIFGIDANGYDQQNVCPFVNQPSSHPLQTRCGQVRRAVLSPNASVDAAVVVITDQGRIPSHGEFAVAQKLQFTLAAFDNIPSFDSGRIHDNPATIDIDARIVKFGAETHLTRGVVFSDGTVVRPLSTVLGPHGNQQKITMKHQIEIRGVHAPTVFFQPGDSGSAVFYVEKLPNNRQELVCIGMAIGCTTYGTGVVTPIADILNALNLTPGTLKSFP